MRDGSPGWLTTVAADYAARGGLDDALVRAATSAEVGLVTIDDDGRVWWSDEAYRLHGRPRWRRVRTIDDLGWGMADGGAVRTAYIATLEDPDVELRYTAVGESGETRALVLRALDRGIGVVHRAAPRVVDVRETPTPATEALHPVPPSGSPVDPSPVTVPEAPETASLPAALEDGPSDTPPAGPPGRTGPPVDDPSIYRSTEDAEVLAAQIAREPQSDTVEPPTPWGQGIDAAERVGLAEAVLSASPDLLLLYDLDNGRVVSVAGNERDAPEIVAHLRHGGHLRDDVHPEDLPTLISWRRGFSDLRDGEVLTTDARFHVGDEWRWRELRVSEFRRDAEGQVNEVVLLVRDVHDRVESSLRVAESERAFREVFGASPVGLAVLDDNGQFTDVNDSFCTLVGRTREAVLATVYEALLHPQDRAAAVISRARRVSQGTSQSSSEGRILRADGTTVWVRVRTSDLDYRGGVHTLVSLEDVSGAKATEDQLRHDALHDELTGLPNRRLIIDRLERAMTRARRTGSRLAVFFIDLDDLKRVNDTHPWKHRAGDQLITSTAAAVRDALRDADTLGRLGGDEFIAICEDLLDESTVDEIGQRILAAATEPLTIGGEIVRPGASIGIATNADEEDADQLLRRADSAMYRAKMAGGSRVVRADSDGRPVAAPLDLAGAVARGELTQHYQPIVSLSTGAVLGVATVVRWRSNSSEPLPSHDVDGGHESSSRATPVVQWSVAQAIRDVRTVAPARVDHVSVWVPLSARAAVASSTRAAIAAALRGPDGTQGGDSAPSIVLDLHEADVSVLTRRNTVHQSLDELLELGPLALGVGHFTADAVPLGVLQQLSAASVSLDPSLLEEAAHNPSTAEVVQALVAAASALGVVTIAMDVTSHDQLELARSLGVHAVHGDLVGPPAPLDTYSDLLHGGRITLPAPPAPVDADDDSGSRGRVGETTFDADEWARMMTARLAEDSTPVVRPSDVAQPAREPDQVADVRTSPSPAVEHAPEVAATPVPEAPAATPPVPRAEPVPAPTTDELPALVDADPEPLPAPTADWLAAPAPAGAPVAMPDPAPAAPSAPVPHGDIAEQLARELGIALPHEDTVPGSFASVDHVETPHWKAVMDQRRVDGPDQPPA